MSQIVPVSRPHGQSRPPWNERENWAVVGAVTFGQKTPSFRFVRAGILGDTGYGSAADSPENTPISKPRDALSDVIAKDATLCELVLLWSSLDYATKDIIATIIKSRTSTL